MPEKIFESINVGPVNIWFVFSRNEMYEIATLLTLLMFILFKFIVQNKAKVIKYREKFHVASLSGFNTLVFSGVMKCTNHITQ